MNSYKGSNEILDMRKKIIQESLGPVVNNCIALKIDEIYELDNHLVDNKRLLVDGIIDDVMSTSIYKDMLESLKNDDCARLDRLPSFDLDSVPISPSFTEVEDSLFLSSSTWSCTDVEQYDIMARKLSPRATFETRLYVLKQIFELACNDHFTHEIWYENVRKNLRICLGDVNDSIFNHATAIFTKVLSSGVPFLLHEGFQDIVMYLKQHLSSKYHCRPYTQITIQDKDHNQTLKLFRLLIDSINLVSFHGVRYPKYCHSALLGAFMDLLSMNFSTSLNSSNLYSPIALAAILDPCSSWLKAYLKSIYGQGIICSVMKDDEKFISKLVTFLIKSIKKIDTALIKREMTTAEEYSYNSQHIQHLKCILSFNTVTEMLRNKTSRGIILNCFKESKIELLNFVFSCLELTRLKCSCTNHHSKFCIPDYCISLISATINVRNSREICDYITEELLNLQCDFHAHHERLHLYRLFSDAPNYTWTIKLPKFLANVVKSAVIHDSVDFKTRQIEFLTLISNISLLYVSCPTKIELFIKEEFVLSFVTLYVQLQHSTVFDSLNEIFTKVLNAILSSQIGISSLDECHLLEDAVNATSKEPMSQLSALSANNSGIRHVVSNNHVLDALPFINIHDEAYFSENTSNIVYNFLEDIFDDGDLLNVVSLRKLSRLVTSLRLLFQVQSKYGIIDKLFVIQSKNTIENSQKIIIDEVSWLCNHILVRILIPGGPTERKLPPPSLVNENTLDKYTLFCDYPVPECYQKGIYYNDAMTPISVKDLKENPFLLKLVSHSLLSDEIPKLLLESVSTFGNKHGAVKLNEASYAHVLKKKWSYGLEYTVRYGKYLGLINSGENQAITNLITVMEEIHTLYPSKQEIDFDFLIATIFLLMKGDTTMTVMFFKNFSYRQRASCIWRLCGSCDHNTSAIHHRIEVIVYEELNEVYSAFKISNFSISHIVRIWTQQLFWSYLDFSQIVQFILLVLIFGADHFLYFVISILRHLKPEILEETQENNLSVFLTTEHINGYEVTDHLDFMNYLHKKYGTDVKKVFVENEVEKQNSLPH